MADRIQVRRDTAANFTSVNPTLSQGEMGLELDTGKLKFGDGSTVWTSLAYFGGLDGDAIHVNVPSEISAITTKLTPTTSDYLLIEDDADSNNKKSIKVSSLPVPTIAHSATTGQTANDHHNQQHALGGADHTSATLAELNALVSDATLDDSGDSRTPTAHNTSHQSGGSDAIKLDDLAAPDDNTDLNVSTSAHGLAPKLPNDATQYLDGTGSYSVPAGGGGGGTNYIACLNFGAKSDSAGAFLIASGISADADVSTRQKSRQPVIIDGTLIRLAYQTKEADTTTQMKVHVNGVVEATVLLSNVSGTYKSGVETISVSVVEGDVVELEWDAGQRPHECIMYFLLEPT